jgi:hypothetical protein
MTLLVPPSSSTPEGDDAGGWRPRSDADLLAAQLAALAEWHRRLPLPTPAYPGQNREARLDEARRQAVAEREREALHDWAAREDFRFGAGSVPRAVVAHRNEWLRAKVVAGLTEHGVEVVASTDDGALAAAAVVMEQPDLLFVEDLLPSISGVDLLRRTAVFAPHAVAGAHALGPTALATLTEAGARATFSRRIPPAEIATKLVDLLHGRESSVSLV